MNKFSPMMQQYFEIKDKYKDYILFFRLGDFYEMFFEDAKLVSKELELTLTGRECGQSGKAPMCGVPHHSSESYIAKLIDKGYKVAICEQTENRNDSKNIVNRSVVRVITPGTIIENSMLDDSKNNFISSIYVDENGIGVCFSDISTGEIFITTITSTNDSERRLINELASFMPKEILTNQYLSKITPVKRFIQQKMNCVVNMLDESKISLGKNKEYILNHFKKDSIYALGFVNDVPQAINALGLLLQYIEFTYKTSVTNLTMLNFYQASQYMNLDISAKKSLEITENIKTQDKSKSLLGVIDKTKTPMGKRMIKKYLDQPLTNSVIINKRLDAVEELVNNSIKRISLIDSFSGIFDIERLLTRIIFKTISPRELKSFSCSLSNIKKVKDILKDSSTQILCELHSQLDLLEDIIRLIDDSILDDPPALLRDGEVIKDGFNAKVDEYRDIIKNSKTYISQIESDEKTKTNIKTLKVGYNKVFGYYIEVSKSFIDKVPVHYIRKQTLANCERYIIQDLKELEEKIHNANEKLLKLEYEIYDKIIESITNHMLRIQKTAIAISQIDVLASFAHISAKNNYTKPLIDNSDIIEIKEGRHPIIESILFSAPFVANDTYIDPNKNKISIITGPNMAGKSTYIRQVALSVLMAQIGCFVPASYAKIGIVDGIFTRIGASDDLSSGKSTYMVEMSEMAYILKNMTSKSLIILDEIGRGTSTYDGMSIAGSIIEYISNNDYNGGKTLFATHYHELSDMPTKFKNIKNYSIAVKKNGDDIIFLHRIVPTSTDKSYGLEVSKLAGIPDEIIQRAKEILKHLESTNLDEYKQEQIHKIVEPQNDNIINLEIINELTNLDPSVLSPIEALNYLYKLKTRL